MANSNIIKKIKNKVIKEIIKDDEIVQAIDSKNVSTTEELIGTHIFDYHQNPNTITDVETFITIQVHIPKQLTSIMVAPRLEIWILSHERHMIVNNVPKVTENRNDYLSELLDKKFNGRSNFGIGELELISNVEGSYTQNWLYRTLIFEITDLNDSLCDEDED